MAIKKKIEDYNDIEVIYVTRKDRDIRNLVKLSCYSGRCLVLHSIQAIQETLEKAEVINVKIPRPILYNDFLDYKDGGNKSFLIG